MRNVKIYQTLCDKYNPNLDNFQELNDFFYKVLAKFKIISYICVIIYSQ